MDLEKYLFKHVRVDTIYGETVVGYVNMFCTAEENEEPYLDSIGIISFVIIISLPQHNFRFYNIHLTYHT